MNLNIIKKIFILLFLILGILIIYQRISPKMFEKFYSFNEQDVVGGYIFYPEVGETEVDLKDMKHLLSLLKSKKYYYEGKTSNVIEGSLYHIKFETKGKMSHDIVISNQGYLLIERKKYKISSGQDILEYLSKIIDVADIHAVTYFPCLT